jgi:hypothetical protein
MKKIKWAIDLLDDGHWHSIDSLRRNVDFSEFEMTELVTFLSDYDLITLDTEGQKVKATSDFKKLITQS